VPVNAAACGSVGLVTTLWLHAQVVEVLGRDGAGPLEALVESLAREPLDPPRGPLERVVGEFRFQVDGLLKDTVGVFEAQPVVGAPARQEPSPGRRALLLPAAVIDELGDGLWEKAYARFEDVSNIDIARQRAGLRFIQQEAIAAIFLPGDYHRIVFAMEPGLAVVLGTADGEKFATHRASRSVSQPSSGQQQLWRRLHDVADAARAQAARLRLAPRTPVPPPTTPLVPLADTWITLNKLEEMGVSGDHAKRAILALNREEDLADIMGMIPDDTFERLELSFRKHHARDQARAARQREAQFTSLEVVRLSRPTQQLQGEMSFEAALAQLTEEQRRVATREHDAPMRVKGGPGTGKTLTAILRAGHLARRAKANDQQVQIGFFVFNADLGRDIATRMDAYGLGEFLEQNARQSIVVTSLHEWCRRFIKLDEIGVEPLEPYRADRTQQDRRAALELAVEEARKILASPEQAELWKHFDAKSKTGLREIETEISQFIKARDITDLHAYMNERRPAKWWLANTGKAFKAFVWEVATIYGDVLRQLGFMDADDLTNDAVKEVSKSVWQTYQKPTQGFDYLILDEAQDFFRNQLTLVRQLVKRPEGFMMCFDEAQAVYARFPSLREIGFDTSIAFEGSRLERNFRSTREIVAALRELATKYAAVGLQEDWGEFQASDGQEQGPRPRAAGFATEDGMLRQVRDLAKAAIERGQNPATIAVIGFDDALLDRIASRLRADGLKTQTIEGDGRRASGRAISIANARFVKGQQFETCILVGLDRDSLPDFRDVKNALHSESRREDDLRLFVVGLSRARREVHLLWCGAEPSEFVAALGHTVDRAE
jgi:superfamily I DNA/RNA helicase